MKKFSISSFIFLFALSLFAQENSARCSAIVLENDNEIPAYIDRIQSGLLYYKKCPDSTNRHYSIPVDIVKFIREPDGKVQSPSSHMVMSSGKVPSKTNNRPLESWIFKQKDKDTGTDKTRVVLQNQSVKVVYAGSTNKVQKVKGYWIKLTDAALILNTQSNSSFQIPKNDIKKIVTYRVGKRMPKKNRRYIFFSIAGGLFLLSLIRIFENADSRGFLRPLTGAVAVSIMLSLIITFLIVVGTAIFSSKSSETIRNPFKGEWEITAPDNEINDVREFYKQP